MPNVKISGPMSYTYLEVGKKRIHLFGDEHSSLDYKCKDKSAIDIVKFLKDKFKSTKEPIDFFVEQAYNTIETPYEFKKKNQLKLFKNSKIQTCYLSKLRTTFLKDGCFRREKEMCNKKYPNIRFHAADYRISIKSIDARKILILYTNVFLNTNYLLSLLYSNNIPVLIKEMSIVLNEYDTISKIVGSFQKCLKTKKMKDQFTKINPKYKKKIERYIKDSIADFRLYSKDYDINVKNLKKALNNKSIPQSYNIMKYLHNILNILWSYNSENIFSLIMDSYLLARMMKDEYNNIIVYAGEAHIQNYILFFTKYMKAKVKSTGKTSTLRCITIKDFRFI